MWKFAASMSFLSLMALASCRPPEPASATAPDRQPTAGFTVTPSGLGILDLEVGRGNPPRAAQTCVIEARGWIEENGQKGRLLLDTRKRGYPDTFPIGVGRVIPGWEEGILTMRKGGRRLLRIPPALGYSPLERGEDIPQGATLLFEVDLIDIR